jgi:hypothetical protein
MTLTVRSATVTGATTKGSALTHAELDENFNHLSQASNHSFTPSGTGTVAGTVEGKNQLTKHLWDFLTEAQRTDVLAGTGSVDIAAAVTAAHANLSALGGGTLKLGWGTALLSSAPVLKNNVDMEGDGLDAFTFDYRGTSQAFVANEAILRTRYTGFTISLVNNSNSSVDGMVFNYGATRCHFDFYLLTKNAAGRNGLVIYGTQSDDGSTANNNQYGNYIAIKTATNDTKVTGVACYLKGTTVANSRCNANVIADAAVLDGFTTGLKIEEGNGNRIGTVTINTATTGIHIYGDSSTTDNIIDGAYLDSGISGDKIKLESTAASAHYMANIIRGTNVSLPSHVALAGANAANITFALNGTLWGFLGSSGLVGVVGAAGTALNAHGKAVVSASTYAGGINAVSNAGGYSAVINTDSSSQFRIVKSSDGSSYTILGYMDVNGNFQLDGSLITTSATATPSAGALDLSAVYAGHVVVPALSANITSITMPASPVDGQTFSIQFRQSAGGGNTVAGWPASVKLAGGAFTLTATASKIDTLTFKYSSGVTSWLEMARSQNL